MREERKLYCNLHSFTGSQQESSSCRDCLEMSKSQRAYPYDFGGGWTQEGMTLRDYFAAKAMQSIIAKIPAVEKEGRDGCAKVGDKVIDEMQKGVALSSYQYADEMLKQRKL